MIGRRYAPLIVLGVIQLLLVILAPSVQSGGGSSSNLAAAGGNGIASGNGATGGNGISGATPDAGGAANGTGAVNGSGPAGGSGGITGGAGGGTSGGAAGGSAAGLVNGGGSGTGAGAASVCGPRQPGPTFYMPECISWNGGNNGGSTMQGVTGSTINVVFDVSQGNPEVNAILQQENLAAQPSQFCAAFKAFTDELNKRWQLYGRKFVSLDGPGNNKGSTQAGTDGKPCGYPYFQSQCSLTPPDPPCERAEADTIAAMHPAYVFETSADPSFYNQAAKDHLIVAGGEGEPDSYRQADAPYFYDSFMNGTRDMSIVAEFYCKQMQGKPVKFAGPDVLGIGPPPKRKVGIVYPETNGDPTYAISVNYFIKQVTGGLCGSPSDYVKGYPYASDITTAQQQSTTTVAAMKSAGVTTVLDFGDPIAPVFFSNTADSQNYHPEILMSGIGLVDYDVLAQLYNPNVWKYAFGISTLQDTLPFANTDAVKAWQDTGNAGLPDQTENLNWAYFTAMGTAFQLAGPHPTPGSIQQGLFNAAPMGGTQYYPLAEYGRPNDYASLHDVRVVYYCPTTASPVNGHPGSYISVYGHQRFQLGSIPGGNLTVFPNGVCA